MLLPTVPPSTPKCWVEGAEEKGGPVSLRCKSPQGSTPMSYTWSRESGGAMPPTATQSKQQTGPVTFPSAGPGASDL